MMEATSELLACHLGAARVGFGEVDDASETIVHCDWTDGRAPSIAGISRLDDYGPDLIEALGRGETASIADLREDPRTSAPEVLAFYDTIAARSSVVVPLIREGRLAALLFVDDAEPRDWPAAEVTLVAETLERLAGAIDCARAESQLHTSEARFRALFEQMPLAAHMVDPAGRTLMVNPALDRDLGVADPSQPRYDALLESIAGPDGKRALIERCSIEGEVVRIPPIRHESQAENGTRHAPWLEALAFPVRDSDGIVREAVFLSQDVTDWVDAGERERLLAREVDHRAKNMLAVVQSVVHLTRAETIEEFKSAVADRIQSLARAHSLLAASRWEGIDLGDLVAQELDPFARKGSGLVRAEDPICSSRRRPRRRLPWSCMNLPPTQTSTAPCPARTAAQR